MSVLTLFVNSDVVCQGFALGRFMKVLDYEIYHWHFLFVYLMGLVSCPWEPIDSPPLIPEPWTDLISHRAIVIEPDVHCLPSAFNLFPVLGCNRS